MTTVIVTLPKNARGRVQVALTRYREHDLVDVRVHADNGAEWVPTAKGVALQMAMLPALAGALAGAEREARAAGFMPPPPEKGDGS